MNSLIQIFSIISIFKCILIINCVVKRTTNNCFPDITGGICEMHLTIINDLYTKVINGTKIDFILALSSELVYESEIFVNPAAVPEVNLINAMVDNRVDIAKIRFGYNFFQRKNGEILMGYYRIARNTLNYLLFVETIEFYDSDYFKVPLYMNLQEGRMKSDDDLNVTCGFDKRYIKVTNRHLSIQSPPEFVISDQKEVQNYLKLTFKFEEPKDNRNLYRYYLFRCTFGLEQIHKYVQVQFDVDENMIKKKLVFFLVLFALFLIGLFSASITYYCNVYRVPYSNSISSGTSEIETASNLTQKSHISNKSIK